MACLRRKQTVNCLMNKNTPHSTVFVMVGIPGSGKSTYSKIHYKNIKYVSRDEIRFSVLKLNEDYFSHEKQVYNIFIKEIVSAIENQQDVCVDATHTTIASRAKLMNAIERNTKNKDLHEKKHDSILLQNYFLLKIHSNKLN